MVRGTVQRSFVAARTAWNIVRDRYLNATRPSRGPALARALRVVSVSLTFRRAPNGRRQGAEGEWWAGGPAQAVPREPAPTGSHLTPLLEVPPTSPPHGELHVSVTSKRSDLQGAMQAAASPVSLASGDRRGHLQHFESLLQMSLLPLMTEKACH